jgi:hypothetical protein
MEITNAKSANFVGVTLGSNLGWEVHAERTCGKTSHYLFIIKRPLKSIYICNLIKYSLYMMTYSTSLV